MTSVKVFITSAAERSVDKLPHKVKDFVLQEFPSMAKQDPYIAKILLGEFAWLRSYHFKIDGQPYRIAYAFDKNVSKIVIHYAGYRGGFYKRLSRLFK